jgi:hypothetical protein
LRGVDPARAWAAKKGWDTRRRTAEHKAREHGKQAREATERRLTPAQRAARTRDARRIKAATEARERPVTKGRRILHSIDDFDDYHPHDDDQEYEVEGHQDGAYSDEE